MSTPDLIERNRDEVAAIRKTVTAIYADAASSGRQPSARDLARANDLTAKADALDARIGKFANEMEARHREERYGPQRIKHDETKGPRIWGEQRSFVADLIAARAGDSHAQQIIAAHDDYARERIGQEARTLITSSGAGAFVPDIYAPGQAFPGTGSPFWDWLQPDILPEGGEVKLPRFTGAFSGGVQAAEGSAIVSSTPTITDASSPVRTFGAATTISYQSLDFSREDYDDAILTGLGNAYYTALEDAALNGDGTGTFKGALAYGTADASHVVTMGTATGPEFVECLAEAVSTVVGSVYEQDLAIFMHPRRLGWLQALTDSDNRPYLAPFSPGVGRAADDVRGYGSAREQARFGGVPIYTSGGVGTDYGDATNEDRVLVLARGALRAWHAANGPRRITVDPDGSTMRWRLVAYNYAALVGARPEGIATIRGTLTPPFV